MKKALALILALTLCLALAACGSSQPAATNAPAETTAPVETTLPIETTEAPVETTAAPTEADDLAILNAWLLLNKSTLQRSMEESFATSAGMTCTSNIELVGTGLVITININELENVPQATKDQLQATYDTMGAEFETMLQQLQAEIPQLTSLTIVVGDKNGDVLATITANGSNATPQDLAAWLAVNKVALLSATEESFATSAGMTCTSNIELVGTGLVITININELEDVSQETKDQLQTSYNSMSAEFEGLLAQLQTEIPQLTSLTIVVGDKDGNPLASISAGQ